MVDVASLCGLEGACFTISRGELVVSTISLDVFFQHPVSTSSREQGNDLKVVSREGVSTLPIRGEMQFGVNEAVREALLQASEAKTRIAVLCREKDEVNELLKSTEHELKQCKDFLKVS